jgi:RNA polymerase sigma factor (sigma-70 family)
LTTTLALDDFALVAAARSGDASAQHAIYDRYSARLHTLACYTLGSRAAAEDALQSIFVKVFQNLHRFEEKSSFATWLWRIALNHCRDEIRRRREFVPLESILGSADDTPSPERLHEVRQIQSIVSRALLELSPKLREVVVLRYIENLPYDEIAAITGCSIGTVSSRLYRGLEQLERILRPLQP